MICKMVLTRSANCLLMIVCCSEKLQAVMTIVSSKLILQGHMILSVVQAMATATQHMEVQSYASQIRELHNCIHVQSTMPHLTG